MSPFLFWIFAVLTVTFGAAVVLNRNPVASALSLVVSFLGLSALFMSLDAFFVGIIQVLVYAGAVMVLFLFIIMLLDLRTERPRNLNIGAWTGGGLVVFGLIGLLGKVLSSELGFDLEKPPVSTQISDVTAIGLMLFRYFNLPFQIVGVLLLVATVGVVLLSKRELK